MSKYDRRTAAIICPYFVRMAKYSLSCEGAIPGTENMIRFATSDDMAEYVDVVCSKYGFHRICPIARELERKYEED